MDYIAIKRVEDNQTLLARVRWCSTFGCKLRGLTFRRQLTADDALILVEAADSTAATSIHMMFVFFPIAVIWINQAGTVVDCQIAKPFRPVYVPQSPARYVLEAPPDLIKEFQLGDRVRFEPIAP